MKNSAGIAPTVSIKNLTLREGNTVVAEAGAALWNDVGSVTALSDSIVRDNISSIYGGGISNWGTLSIVRSEIRNNRLPEGGGGVTSQGGGIFNVANLKIHCSAITENFATRGGGISNLNSTSTKGVMEIKNSTISANRALGGGGGIRNAPNARMKIAWSTITNNQANEPCVSCSGEANRFGGGILNLAQAEMVSIGGTILAGNTDNRSKSQQNYSPDCYSSLASPLITYGSNLVGVINPQCQVIAATGNSMGADFTGTDTMPLDPKLDQLADNGGLTRTHAVQVGSSAIDGLSVSSGPPQAFFACSSGDQRGYSRPAEGDGSGEARCDIGGFERNSAPPLANPAPCDIPLELPVPPSAPTGLIVK